MTRSSLRVLLVDDDADYRLLFQKTLESHPHTRFELTAVPDYPTALTAATSGGFDVCLVDFFLGEKNGLDLLKECRQRECDLPFILLTGHGDPEIDRKALESGAVDYLEKYHLEAPILERAIRYAVQRHRDLQTLRKSESNYRILMEESADAFFVCDLELDLLDANPVTCRLSGFSKDEILRMNVVDFLIPEDLKENPLQSERLLRGETVENTRRIRRKEGSSFFADIKIRRIPGDRIVGILRDVTERKQAEDTLQQREVYFRQLLENSRDVAIIIDGNGNICYEAPSTKRVLGRKPGEMVGRNAFINIHPEDREGVRNAFKEIASHPGATTTLELRMLHNDGSWRHIEGNAQNLMQDPLIRGVVINYRDVTERHRAELALQNSEKHFRALIENTTEVVLTADEKGTIQYVSPSMERVLGYSPAERVGKNLFDIWDPADAVKGSSVMKDLLANPGSIFRAEVRVHHKDGSWRTMEGTAQNLLHRPEIAGFVLNYRDVTERREAQERLLRYERLAALGEIAAGLAHEIRNPLATILSTVQYLKTKTPDPKCVNDLDNILVQGDRIKLLVNETLDYSKKPVFQFERMDVRELLAHSLNLAQNQFGPDNGKTRVILEIPKTLPEIRADRRHIEQVMVNLILNAYQAVPPEGGHIFLKCAIIGEEIILKVQDDGPGIKDEDLPRVFDPFFTTKKRGSGLGLSISQRVAQEHGGRIDVERLKPQGTAFVLRLPVFKEGST